MTARLNFVKKARRPVPEYDIEVGDSYYWWKFRFGRKHFSKKKPSRSQLTQSNFLSQVFDIVDQTINNLSPDETLPDELSSVIDQLEELRSEQEDHLQNMPDHLQESSSSGQTLTEYIDELDNWISELQSIEAEVDEETIRSETTANYLLSKEAKVVEDLEKDDAETLEDEIQEAIETARQDIIEEIQGASPY